MSKVVKEADLHDAPHFSTVGQLPKKIFKNVNTKLSQATLVLAEGVLVIKSPAVGNVKAFEVGIPMTNVKGLLFELEAEKASAEG